MVFRIPEIMAEWRENLREVGTTNRTSVRDYESAMNENARVLLRVHPSNFKITGFAEKPSLAELVALSGRTAVPLVEDLGSGSLVDLAGCGFAEPTVRQSIEASSLVMFSGDKLLGDQQAGIIAGKKELVQRVRRNPLFRALRVDKLTIAALEVTLNAYLRSAWEEIPAQRMIRARVEELEVRAENFVERVQAALPSDAGARMEIADGFSLAGGGSTPDQTLATKLFALQARGIRRRNSRVPAEAGCGSFGDCAR